MATLLGLIAWGLLAVGGSEVSSAVSLVAARTAAGADVATVSVPEGEALSAAACAQLARSEAVVDAGADFGEDASIEVLWQPSRAAVRIVDLTLGALRVWWPAAPATGGLFVGHDLRVATGLAPGMTVTFDGAPERITGELPSFVAPATWQAAVVRIVPPVGQAAECWLRMSAGTARRSDAVATAGFPDNHLTTAPFVRPDSLSADPQLTLESSAARRAWLAAAAVAIVCLLLLALTTRGELGIYRVTGTSWPELMAMALVQMVILVLVPISLATASFFLVLEWRGAFALSADTIWYLVQPVVMTALLMWVAGGLIQVAAGTGAAVDTMRT